MQGSYDAEQGPARLLNVTSPIVEAGLGRIDAVAGQVPDEEHDDVGRKVVGAVVVKLLPARAATLGHLQKLAEQPSLPTGRAASHEPAPHSLRRGNRAMFGNT